MVYSFILGAEGDLRKQVNLNEELISNLREFFGSYLSNFLKEYRNPEHKPDESLSRLLKRQDDIFEKFHSLMKDSTFIANKGDSVDISSLKEYVDFQHKIIYMIKQFFSSNSSFIRFYRKHSSEHYGDMERCLDEQDKIYDNLCLLLRDG